MWAPEPFWMITQLESESQFSGHPAIGLITIVNDLLRKNGATVWKIMIEWILEEQFMDSVGSVVWPVVDLCEHG